MNFMKRVNGSWVDTPNYIHKTDTDTITTLPAVLYPNAVTATVGLKGQTVQSSTPSPLHPSLPQGTGERTGNLFDIENITHKILATNGSVTYESAMNLSELIRVDGDYTVSWNAVRSGAYMRVSTYDDNKNFIARIVAQNTYTRSSYSSTHTGYIRINYENSYQLSDVQVNTGSTPLPYEIFGYKIPILSAGQTTPVYLGEVETTRKIAKIDLGTINWGKTASGNFWASAAISNIRTIGNASTGNAICDMFKEVSPNAVTNEPYSFSSCLNTVGRPFINKTGFENLTAEEFKQAMSGVYMYYVLATPETAVVNEPLCKIGDYADEVSGITIPTIAGTNTLSVGTTLQPSEVTINYKGWHPVSAVHERESGAWT